MRPLVPAVLVLLSGVLAAVTQQAYLKASNTEEQDDFGRAVSVSGDTVVVGAPFEASSATGVGGDPSDNGAGGAGAAYVFVRGGATWGQQAYLKASNTDEGDEFGWSVALSGDTLVVGAPMEDSGAVGVDGDQADDGALNSGAAYVFVRTGATWTQQAYLKASNAAASDNFGFAVAVSGDTVVVGALTEDSSASGVNGDENNDDELGSGAAYVFVRSGTTWSQQAYLKASNPGANDLFGVSVAIAGDTVVVGASVEDSSATGVDGDQGDDSAVNSGAAYVFRRTGTSWAQEAYLKASNTEALDGFGIAVAISGDTIVVGAHVESSSATGVDGDQADNGASAAGAAYVFERSGTIWSQQAYLKASNTDAVDRFGVAVSISGDEIAVGALGEASAATGVDGVQGDDSATQAGAAYSFVRSGASWVQRAYLKASNTDPLDQFGSAVSVSAGTVVVGAHWENGGATGVDGNPADESATDAGAAYVFDLGPDPWLDLGGGSPGLAGVPLATGSGSLVGGTTASVSLTDAPPGAAMVAWISFAPTPFAALGGTVHAFPFSSQLFLFADAGGAFSGATTWPTGVPSGTEVFFQFIVQDLSVPDGLTLSNGLKATTP